MLGGRRAASWAQNPYYQGKTITILRGGSPGGYGDLQARALIPYLKRYIPGEPAVIIEHKQGAAGRTAVNYIYSTAKPDGLTIGAVGNVLVSGPILGLAGSNYDLDKLIYLGSTESGSPTAFITRKDAGFDSVEKLRAATGIRIGAHSVGHITLYQWAPCSLPDRTQGAKVRRRLFVSGKRRGDAPGRGGRRVDVERNHSTKSVRHGKSALSCRDYRSQGPIRCTLLAQYSGNR